MKEGNQFLYIIAIALMIFGGSMIYASGYFTGGQTRGKTVTPRITTIVITQTRVPPEPFVGKWSCENADATLVEITANRSFYDVTIAGDQLKATKQGEELLIPPSTSLTLNPEKNILIVRLSAEKSFFCKR